MLKDKNIIITGANRGIGLACVERFLKEQSNVIAVVRNFETSKLDALEGLKDNKNLFIYQTNLENEHDIKINIREIIAKFNNIDVLVNNAGQIFNGLFQRALKKALFHKF